MRLSKLIINTANDFDVGAPVPKRVLCADKGLGANLEVPADRHLGGRVAVRTIPQDHRNQGADDTSAQRGRHFQAVMAGRQHP